MKSGDAVFLYLAATLENPAHDLTLVFYDREEIAAEFNGPGTSNATCPSGWPPTSRSSVSRRPGSSRPAVRARCGCA